jgi:hypothetical protein
MKNYKLFCEKKGEGYFYKIHFNDIGIEDYLICDLEMCAKSHRTFDIKFFDLAKNRKLQKILFDFYVKDVATLADYLVSRGNDGQKEKKLLTNPTIRILAESEEMFLNVLEIFDPDDIRVITRRYNL